MDNRDAILVTGTVLVLFQF